MRSPEFRNAIPLPISPPEHSAWERRWRGVADVSRRGVENVLSDSAYLGAYTFEVAARLSAPLRSVLGELRSLGKDEEIAYWTVLLGFVTFLLLY